MGIQLRVRIPPPHSLIGSSVSKEYQKWLGVVVYWRQGKGASI